MDLHFSAEGWDQLKAVSDLWWEGSLGRPLVHTTLHGQPTRIPEPALPSRAFTAHYGDEVSPEAIVDRWTYELSSCRFPADGFPVVWPNFGPGVLAAFCGCDMRNTSESVWFHSPEPVSISDLQIHFDSASPAFTRVAAIMRAAADCWQGQVQIGMTDLGGSLDVVASFRPSEALLLDLYDCPDEVLRTNWQVHEAWVHAFSELDAILRPVNPGYTAWAPIFSTTPSYMLQCDFCFMIGPEMFDRFVKPELAATCKRIDRPFYHLDGPGELPHLDSLLDIDELAGIQWIPGDGAPNMRHWPDVYRRITEAGKKIQLFSGIEADGSTTLDVVAEQTGRADNIVQIMHVSPQRAHLLPAFLRRWGLDG